MLQRLDGYRHLSAWSGRQVHDPVVGQQVRPFHLPAIYRPFLELAMNTGVGHVGQPAGDLDVGGLGINGQPGGGASAR